VKKAGRGFKKPSIRSIESRLFYFGRGKKIAAKITAWILQNVTLQVPKCTFLHTICVTLGLILLLMIRKLLIELIGYDFGGLRYKKCTPLSYLTSRRRLCLLESARGRRS
jgi:hypothetical protein